MHNYISLSKTVHDKVSQHLAQNKFAYDSTKKFWLFRDKGSQAGLKLSM